MLRKLAPALLALLGLTLLLAPLAGRGAESVAFAAAGEAAHAPHGGNAGRDSGCEGDIAGTPDAGCPHCADAARGDCFASHHGCCFGGIALPPAAAPAQACALADTLNPRRPALHPLARAADIFRPPRFHS
jgi:hypothetical protein